jgi:uncharacterized protein YjbI with pentapeptide repeats
MTTNHEDSGKGQGSGSKKSESFEFPAKLQEILADHHLWLESRGKDGKQANLSGWDLSGLDLAERDLRDINFEDVQLVNANLSWAELDRANLSGANLQEANLSQAHLQESDLHRANLERADLTGANLRNARLMGANFQEAKLLKANFRDADLQDAKLTQSQDLLGWQLAGANLTTAELPASFGRFEELDHAGEITKTTATLLWTLLTGCLYACLTVANTHDASFYVSAASLKLPILDASIPTWGFFVLAPAVLLAWYFYFLLNLQRLWEALVTLPALFPDGMRLDQKASPWFITGLVCSYFPQLQAQKPAFLRTQKFLSMILVWWIVPLTLIFIWTGYLKARFWPITLVQVLAICAAIFLGRRTWQVAKATLKADEPRPPRRDLAFSLISVVVLLMLSLEVVNLVPPRLEPELVAEYQKRQTFGLNVYYIHKGISSLSPTMGRMIEWIFTRPFVNIDYEDVSFKPKGSPEDWDDLKEPELNKYLERVRGARLRHTNLRHGHAKQVFLAKANLEGANLDGAYLYKADLRDANLTGADLFNAFLAEAYFQGANLQDVDFRWANLRYASFQGADLTKADLKGANVEGADFRKAAGLTADQIKNANCWPLALYGQDLLAKLGLPENHNHLLHEKNFSGYNLYRGNLEGANLFEFNLEKARLKEVDLREANLAKANLRGADLEEAKLTKADLKGANLTDVKNLTRQQLEAANYKDKNTRLPGYLVEPPR